MEHKNIIMRGIPFSSLEKPLGKPLSVKQMGLSTIVGQLNEKEQLEGILKIDEQFIKINPNARKEDLDLISQRSSFIRSRLSALERPENNSK